MGLLTEPSVDARDFANQLYKAVDALNAKSVGRFLTQDVRFQLGNFDEIVGYQAVVAANHAFLQSSAAMSHTLKDAGTVGNTVICASNVHYTRSDKST